jgi:asparagine synthase (glutamine-hydrolysing)
MCGIAGYVGPETVGLHRFDQKILESIAYRGKDARTRWSDGRHVTLLHARLSIIDLEGGRQPMTEVSGRYVIVFNGAIYNYRELRSEYERAGAAFRTSSDTEVILHGFALKGERVVHDLNGMFAFAIWDAKEHRLFVARDRLGKKPLFWTKLDNQLIFASTIAAFRGLPSWNDRLSATGLTFFKFLGGFPESETAYACARALPPASLAWYRIGDAEPRISRYWRPNYRNKASGGFHNHLEEYGALVTDAVRVRLRSDVPLGLSFSGGVDSGTIAAVAQTELGTDLSCFTLDYHTSGEPSDEVECASQVAMRLGLPWRHIHYDYRRDMLDGLRDVYAYFDQPCHQFPLVYSKRLYDAMKPHCTVVLSGNGADELFTGYIGDERIRHQDIRRYFLRNLPNAIYRQIPEKYRLGWNHDRLDSLSIADWARLDWTSYARRFAPDEATAMECGGTIDAMVEELRLCGIDTMLDFFMHRALLVSAADSNYRLPDITGYAAQVEVRCPYFDHRIVEFAARLPHRFKVASAWRKPKVKYLPRVFYQRYVGDEIAWARKKPMGANLRWDLALARDPHFMEAARLAYDSLDDHGIASHEFRGAYRTFCGDIERGAVTATAGVMMSGFMLGAWLRQTRAASKSIYVPEHATT